MNPKGILYSAGYKYQLEQTYTVLSPIRGFSIQQDFYQLMPSGMLIIRKGYAWDGASGPTFDTDSSMRPSLVHDVFCQMMRAGQLPHTFRTTVNEFFREQCLDAGMWGWRAYLWFKAVELANAGDPAQGPDHEILEAP